MRYKKGQINIILLLALAILLLTVLIFTFKSLFFSSDRLAIKAVDKFYSYEQNGEFSSSWELFHSNMKKKFTKGHYIQDRAHVFMNHFGVETFTYTLGKPEKLKSWKMSKEEEAIKPIYKITVIQTFKGKYGNFDIEQEVFVGKEKGEWKILWDYHK